MRRTLVSLIISVALMLTTIPPAVARTTTHRIHGTLYTTMAGMNDQGGVHIVTDSSHPSTVARLGRVELDQWQTVAPTSFQPGGLPASGTITIPTDAPAILTAADGSELHFASDGPAPFAMDESVGDGIHPIQFAGQLEITGGTGRFEGATGQLSFHGGFCFMAGMGFFVIDGEITVAK